MSIPLPILRDTNVNDVSHLLRLNEAVVEVTSFMDERRYRRIANEACLDIVAEIDGQVVGFLLALRSGANYDNDNYHWFSRRYNDFVYIDRVVVDEDHQGDGIGQLFYSYVLEWAGEQQLRAVVCEIDIEPPNTNSLRFHEKLGFEEVGRRKLSSNKKVSMRIKNL